MATLITTNELCELLKVSRTAIANWREEGMPYEKYGKIVRFDEEIVLEWLRNKGNSNDKK